MSACVPRWTPNYNVGGLVQGFVFSSVVTVFFVGGVVGSLPPFYSGHFRPQFGPSFVISNGDPVLQDSL